jgi:hypothetical protein
MLAFDPAQRVTAANALQEGYFTSEEPAAQSPEYVFYQL